MDDTKYLTESDADKGANKFIYRNWHKLLSRKSVDLLHGIKCDCDLHNQKGEILGHFNVILIMYQHILEVKKRGNIIVEMVKDDDTETLWHCIFGDDKYWLSHEGYICLFKYCGIDGIEKKRKFQKIRKL